MSRWNNEVNVRLTLGFVVFFWVTLIYALIAFIKRCFQADPFTCWTVTVIIFLYLYNRWRS